MTHDDLVERAAKWLRTTMRCRCVLTETAAGNMREIPDVLGWNGKRSILVECKRSRSDFKADAKKIHRQFGGLGMFRWYFAPKGLISPEEIPENWGLAEWNTEKDRVFRTKVSAKAQDLYSVVEAERELLLAVLRRFEVRDLMGVLKEPL